MPYGVKVIIVAPAGYATPMTATTPVLRNMDDHWNDAPEEMQQEYGLDFQRRCKGFGSFGHVVTVTDITKRSIMKTSEIFESRFTERTEPEISLKIALETVSCK